MAGHMAIYSGMVPPQASAIAFLRYQLDVNSTANWWTDW